MNDYLILQRLAHNQQKRDGFTRGALAKRLGVCALTLRNWFGPRAGQMPAAHASKLFNALDLGNLILRQPCTTEELPMTEVLRMARRNLGLTGAQVAKVLGVSQATLSNWERGSNNGPPIYLLERWVVYLGMGGITTEHPPLDNAACPIEWHKAPIPQFVQRMVEDGHYEARRYIPYSVEYAKLRLQAMSVGIDEPHFYTHRTFRGQSLMLAKFRPLWTKFAVKHRCVDKGLDNLVELLEQRANTLDK